MDIFLQIVNKEIGCVSHDLYKLSCNDFWQKAVDEELKRKEPGERDVLMNFFMMIGYLKRCEVDDMEGFVYHKYKFLKKVPVNIFIDQTTKTRFMEVFSRIQKKYLCLIRFVYLWKYKRAKLITETDLYLNPIDLKKNMHIELYHCKSRYLFSFSDIINLHKTALGHYYGWTADPVAVKNPYNNLPFTLGNLYQIYFTLKKSIILMPEIIHLFFLSNFNLDVFARNHEAFLIEQLIKNRIANHPPEVLRTDIVIMLKTATRNIQIDPDFPNHILSRRMKPFLYYYYVYKYGINGRERRDWALNTLRSKLKEFEKTNKLFGRKIMKPKEQKYVFNVGEDRCIDGPPVIPRNPTIITAPGVTYISIQNQTRYAASDSSDSEEGEEEETEIYADTDSSETNDESETDSVS
jgi:hypothetical protein